MAGKKDTNEAEELSSEDKMDLYLASLGKFRKHMAGDGSCLFRTVSEHVFHCQARHMDVRMACVDYLKSHKEEYMHFIPHDFDLYVFDLQHPRTWGGDVEISVLSKVYNLQFTIYQERPEPGFNTEFAPPRVVADGVADALHPNQIEVCFTNNNHYDIVYTLAFMESVTAMQDVLYDVLRTSLGIDFTRDPAIAFRNVEYDAWRADSEARITKKQQAGSGNWQVGSTCQALYTEDKCWHEAEITKVLDDGRYEVRFFQFGGRQTVNNTGLRSEASLPKGFQYKRSIIDVFISKKKAKNIRKSNSKSATPVKKPVKVWERQNDYGKRETEIYSHSHLIQTQLV
eukprot:m.48937 g.48937  ORF g.48937 m.48937 type:complete len:342 (-) comp12776_c0_seq1:45-1070(-)